MLFRSCFGFQQLSVLARKPKHNNRENKDDFYWFLQLNMPTGKIILNARDMVELLREGGALNQRAQPSSFNSMY